MRKNDLLTLDEIKERIKVQFDEELLLDILGLDITELVDILEEQIEDNIEDILRHLYE